MINETEKIKRYIKKNHLATIGHIATLLDVSKITAERRLIDLEIKGEILREEYNPPKSKRTFKQWRLKKK